MLLMFGDGVDTVHRNFEDLLMRWCRRWRVMSYCQMNDGDAESRVPGMLTTGREINEVHTRQRGRMSQWRQGQQQRRCP